MPSFPNSSSRHCWCATQRQQAHTKSSRQWSDRGENKTHKLASAKVVSAAVLRAEVGHGEYQRAHTRKLCVHHHFLPGLLMNIS